MKPFCLTLLGVLSAISVSATTLLDDSFSYSNATEMINGGWSGGATSYVSVDSTANQAITLNSLSRYYDFTAATGATVTQDFTLTVSADLSSYSRQFYVLVVSEPDAGNVVTGYGFLWNSSVSTSWGGLGYVQVTKVSYDLDTTNLSTGTTPGSGTSPFNTQVGSGVSATPNSVPTATSDYNSFVFSWDSDTSSISLSVNGVTKITKTDSSYSSFSRVYIGGTFPSSYLDSISLTTTATIPEPSSFAAMAGGLGLMAVMVVRRKRPAGVTA